MIEIDGTGVAVIDGGGGARGSCQMFPWHLTHKPKHKQRPKPRNRDANPKTKTQARLALDQSCWHGTIAMVVMWSSKIHSQMSPWHWFEKKVEDGSGKNGFWPWKRESLAAVGIGEREGVAVGVVERERESLWVWLREREREREPKVWERMKSLAREG